MEPNGRELFYRSGRKMMAVDIATQSGFAAGKPRMLFEGDYLPTPLQFPNYDVSPDGQRFLINAAPADRNSAPVTVIANWSAPLRK